MSTEDEKIRTRLAEIMSSAGLGYNQISLEILYLLPAEFVNRYIWLWEKALGPAGSGDARGQQLARDANLGRAQTKTAAKGNKIGAGAGGQGKKFKRIGMSIRDERALELKSRIDRRLRSIARDIRNFELDDRDSSWLSEKKTAQCASCGRIMDESWVHCPYDGSLIRLDASKKAR